MDPSQDFSPLYVVQEFRSYIKVTGDFRNVSVPITSKVNLTCFYEREFSYEPLISIKNTLNYGGRGSRDNASDSEVTDSNPLGYKETMNTIKILSRILKESNKDQRVSVKAQDFQSIFSPS